MPETVILISTKKSIKKWILLGIPVLIIIGSLMHFIYKWSGNSLFVGLLAPVSESVWEHLKMTFLPVVAWWIIGYLVYKDKCNISAAKWFTSCALSVLVCPLVIISFYYTHTGAFGIESLILDIFSMILGLTLGQFLALHVYKYSKLSKYWLYVSIAALLVLAAAFIIFTVEPPKIPLFMAS